VRERESRDFRSPLHQIAASLREEHDMQVRKSKENRVELWDQEGLNPFLNLSLLFAPLYEKGGKDSESDVNEIVKSAFSRMKDLPLKNRTALEQLFHKKNIPVLRKMILKTLMNPKLEVVFDEIRSKKDDSVSLTNLRGERGKLIELFKKNYIELPAMPKFAEIFRAPKKVSKVTPKVLVSNQLADLLASGLASEQASKRYREALCILPEE
jgi:hypothetical protein